MRGISRILIIIMITLYGGALLAGSTNDLIQRELQRRNSKVKKILIEQNNFVSQKQRTQAQLRVTNYSEIISKLKERYRTQRQMQKQDLDRRTPSAMIFVSLGMPEAALKQIIQDGLNYQIPVVIRGLYRNSFKETFKKIFELVKVDNQGGILINPRWFRDYKIEAVPALVVTSINRSNDQNQTKNQNHQDTYDIIYGNLKIKRALELLSEQGDLKEIAKGILNRGSL